MKKLVALRTDYISKIKTWGFEPRLSPPEIIMDNPRSFGNFENDKNILHTCDWNTLSTQQHQLFENFGKNMGVSGEKFFTLGVHQWIFVHELSHWWRACQHQTAEPYENEKAANRLAAAYWNDRDPAFYKFMVQFFSAVVAHSPNPVPAGIGKEQYLDDNYQKLPGGSTYTWYQSIMIKEISQETPLETFKQAVQFAGKPL